MNKISKVRKFIDEQSIYIWMLVFIIFFNTANIIFKTVSEPGRIKFKEGISNVQNIMKEDVVSKEDIMTILTQDKTFGIIFSFTVLIAILVFILGIVLCSKFIVSKLKGKNPIESYYLGHLEINWGIWDVCRVVILFLFFGYSFQIIEATFSPFLHLKNINGNLALLLNTTLMDGIVFIFTIYFVKQQYKQTLAAIGLRSENFFKNIALGITGYIAILPILVITLLMVLWASYFLKYVPPPQPVFDLFLQESRSKILIYSTVLVALLGPVIEEVFFRGFMYNAIKAKFGIGWGVILTSALFAGLHANPLGFLPIMVLGVLLVYLYEKTGSLIPSITIHILHNSLMISFLFLMKELAG